MDRAKAKVVRAALEKALKTIDPALGLNFEIGNGRYSYTEIEFKVIALEKSSGSSSRAEADWKKYAASFGLSEVNLGDTFMLRGKVFEITGLKPRSHKYPVLATRSDGKVFKFPAEDVVMNVKSSGRIGV